MTIAKKVEELKKKFVINGVFTGVEFIDESRISELFKAIETSLREVETDTIQMCIDLSDKLESQETTEFNEWKRIDGSYYCKTPICQCHKPQQESKEQRGYCGNCNKEVVYSRFHFDGFCVDRVFTIQDQPQQEGGGETKTSKEDKDTISFNSESNNGEEKPVEKNCIFCQYHLTHMKHFELKQSKKKAIIGMDKRIEEPSKKEECLCQYISDEVESMCCKKKESSPAQVLIA